VKHNIDLDQIGNSLKKKILAEIPAFSCWYGCSRLILLQNCRDFQYCQKGPDILRTVPGNQEFIILSASRLDKMHDREKMFIIHWWSMYTVRLLATGFSATIPATRRRHFLMSFSSDQVASHVSLEDGTAFGGVLGFWCLFGGILFISARGASSDYFFLGG
jgi:hypothetical protein